MLTQEALNPFVECASGLVGGEGLAITRKLGLERSIEHIRFSRTTVMSTPDGEVVRNTSLEARDRRRARFRATMPLSPNEEKPRQRGHSRGAEPPLVRDPYALQIPATLAKSSDARSQGD